MSQGTCPQNEKKLRDKLSKEERYKRRKERLREKEELRSQEKKKADKAQEKIDRKFMKAAIKEAKKAAEKGEVPIGCVIVRDGEVIAKGYNRRNTDHQTISHAEMRAIKKASKRLSDWRLEGCTMYVTLEPCQMCSGALVQSRIDRVVIGCDNPKAGCAGSVLNVLQEPAFNHKVEITRGVRQEECSKILKEFFEAMRRKKAKGAEATDEEAKTSKEQLDAAHISAEKKEKSEKKDKKKKKKGSKRIK